MQVNRFVKRSAVRPFRFRLVLGLGALLIGLSLFCPVFASDADLALQIKLTQQLEAILGPGKAKVTVSSQTTAASQSRSVEHSQPQINNRSLIESQSQPGGSRRLEQEQFVFDTTETLTTNPATVGARSVAVVYQPGSDPEKPSLQEQEIYDLVSAGMGFNAQQGDRLIVKATYFDTQWQDKLQADLDKSRRPAIPWLWIALAVMGLVLGLALGYAWSRHRFKQQRLQQSELDWQTGNPLELSSGQINASTASLAVSSDRSTSV